MAPHFRIVGIIDTEHCSFYSIIRQLQKNKRKGVTMISSPCKDCQKKNFPKDECLKDCQLIQNIQGMQLARKESNVYTAVDFSEESRFQIASPFASALNIC
jgi:hypothetical protein